MSADRPGSDLWAQIPGGEQGSHVTVEESVYAVEEATRVQAIGTCVAGMKKGHEKRRRHNSVCNKPHFVKRKRINSIYRIYLYTHKETGWMYLQQKRADTCGQRYQVGWEPCHCPPCLLSRFQIQ